jgi:hypothetical protein
MALDVNILKASLTAIYTATTNTNNATALSNAICNYLIPITPASTGVESGRAQMIATFNSFAGQPNGHINALTTALPVYAAVVASGMSPEYTGTAPTSVTLPNFTSLYKALTDVEASHADCATIISAAIHTWFSSGTATHNIEQTTVNWGTPVKVSIIQKLKNKIDKAVTVLSADYRKIMQSEYNTIKNSSEVTTKEYAELIRGELNQNELVSAPINVDNTEVLAGIKNTPTKFRSTIGERIIAVAIKDIGMKETLDKNYGGIPSKRKTSIGQRFGFTDKTSYKTMIKEGRIDEMLKQTGTANPKSVGEGYFWCAAAVTSWYLEANADGPRSAGVSRWKEYAQKEKRFTSNPILGSAIIYNFSHIGIVAGVIADKNGIPTRILTIEGNTKGGKGERNGNTVAYKSVSATSKTIVGYFNPASK